MRTGQWLLALCLLGLCCCGGGRQATAIQGDWVIDDAAVDRELLRENGIDRSTLNLMADEIFLRIDDRHIDTVNRGTGNVVDHKEYELLGRDEDGSWRFRFRDAGSQSWHRSRLRLTDTGTLWLSLGQVTWPHKAKD